MHLAGAASSLRARAHSGMMVSDFGPVILYCVVNTHFPFYAQTMTWPRNACASNEVRPTPKIAVPTPFTTSRRCICASVRAICVIPLCHSCNRRYCFSPSQPLFCSQVQRCDWLHDVFADFECSLCPFEIRNWVQIILRGLWINKCEKFKTSIRSRAPTFLKNN